MHGTWLDLHVSVFVLTIGQIVEHSVYAKGGKGGRLTDKLKRDFTFEASQN